MGIDAGVFGSTHCRRGAGGLSNLWRVRPSVIDAAYKGFARGLADQSSFRQETFERDRGGALEFQEPESALPSDGALCRFGMVNVIPGVRASGLFSVSRFTW